MISVCIPTMPGRESTLSRLLHQLDGHRLDVMVHTRVAPMGDKLNEMFAQAQGDYVVCVDDDDLFFPSLIHGIDWDAQPDFVGWKILVSINGRVAGEVEHRFGQDPQATWTDRYRGVSPKCLVCTDIARQVPFGNEYTADREWSREVQSLCRTAAFVDELVYHYDHWESAMLGTNPGDKPHAQQRDVGKWSYSKHRPRWLA